MTSLRSNEIRILAPLHCFICLLRPLYHIAPSPYPLHRPIVQNLFTEIVSEQCIC